MYRRYTACAVAFLVMAFAGYQPASAQLTSIEDNFIFFVDGANVLIPNSTAQVVADPADPESGNQVARFAYGNWAEPGFQFDAGTGVDATGLVGAEIGEGSTLHLRLWVDPANQGMGGVRILFTDKTDGTGDDPPFRAAWEIPAWARDGSWYDFSIPLPPTTVAALDSAKIGKAADGSDLAVEVDSLMQYWSYAGAWVGGEVGGIFDQGNELWQEFEWQAVKQFGLQFDNNTGGGPILIDDMYIGEDGFDLSVAKDPPDPMTGVTLTSEDGTNTVGWTHDDKFGGYNVYVSEFPITDVSSSDVALLGTVAFNAETFALDHSVVAPHPALAANKTIYYAVTATSLFGVENKDVSASSEAITSDLEADPFIFELNEAEVDVIFGNLSQGVVSGEGFPAELFSPLVTDSGHSKALDVAVGPDTDADLSAKTWIGYYTDAATGLSEMYIYAEVLDDALNMPPADFNTGDGWMFDSVELMVGFYDQESFLLTNDHFDGIERGEEPDYQFRITPLMDDAGNIAGAHFWETHSNNAELVTAGSIADFMLDGDGNRVGYKVLAFLPLDGIQGPDSGDIIFETPASDELRVIPFNLVFNDNDSGATRDHQIGWSLAPTAAANFWNNPQNWGVVAIAGRDFVTTDSEVDEIPEAYTLGQNYPNPFNPQTTISFSLSNAQPVTLTVFNALGQEVRTLVSNQTFAPGAYNVTFDAAGLSSGLYLYRLDAGSAFTQTRSMMVIK
ncbi:MAG: T9SS type A sorting domain-containing protein [Bacteroidota bacterium]